MKRWPIVVFELVLVAVFTGVVVAERLGFAVYGLPWWLLWPVSLFMIVTSLAHLWLIVARWRRKP